jgi:hypothetical protein
MVANDKLSHPGRRSFSEGGAELAADDWKCDVRGVGWSGWLAVAIACLQAGQTTSRSSVGLVRICGGKRDLPADSDKPHGWNCNVGALMPIVDETITANDKLTDDEERAKCARLATRMCSRSSSFGRATCWAFQLRSANSIFVTLTSLTAWSVQ